MPIKGHETCGHLQIDTAHHENDEWMKWIKNRFPEGNRNIKMLCQNCAVYLKKIKCNLSKVILKCNIKITVTLLFCFNELHSRKYHKRWFCVNVSALRCSEESWASVEYLQSFWWILDFFVKSLWVGLSNKFVLKSGWWMWPNLVMSWLRLFQLCTAEWKNYYYFSVTQTHNPAPHYFSIRLCFIKYFRE